MRTTGVAVLIAVLISQSVLTQAPPRLAFDVASVKRNQDIKGSNKGLQIRPEQLEALGYPVQGLIIEAYGIPAGRIVGVPDWARTEWYDVRARTSKPSSRQEVRAMLQTLLAERFAMKVHRDMREMDVFALVVARPGSLGPKLKPVILDCETNTLAGGSGPGLFPADTRPPCGNMISNARVMPDGGASLVRNRFAAVTMEAVASGLASTGRPVIDRTGLTGTFDVELEYLSQGVSPAATTDREVLNGMPLRDALRQQLGLELRPERGPIEYLVIDSLQRPTPD
jgi:uncharacterized protein (TIGR03435 family)